MTDTRMEQAHQQSLPLDHPEWYQTSDQYRGEKKAGGDRKGVGAGLLYFVVSKREPVPDGRGEDQRVRGRVFQMDRSTGLCIRGQQGQGDWTTASRARL